MNGKNEWFYERIVRGRRSVSSGFFVLIKMSLKSKQKREPTHNAPSPYL